MISSSHQNEIKREHNQHLNMIQHQNNLCLSIISLKSVIYKKFTRWKYVGQIFNFSFVFVFFRLYHPRQKGTEKNGPAVNKNNGRNSSRYFCGLERWVPAVPRHIWICHSWAANFGTATQFHYWQWNRFCHEWSSSITTQYVAKVLVFCAGHKNFKVRTFWEAHIIRKKIDLMVLTFTK